MKRLLAVKASAGTGKTFRLATRYISLIAEGENPQNIVAITFTNKAANEMKERIGTLLKNLEIDTPIAEAICRETNLSKNKLMEIKSKLIKQFFSSHLNIQTIDSFITKVVKRFSFYVDIKSNFDIGKIDKETVFEKFLKNLAEKEFEELIKIAKTEEKFKGLKYLFEDLYDKDKELDQVNLKKPTKPPNEEKAKKEFNKFKKYILESDKASNSAKKAVNIDFHQVPSTTWFSKDKLKEYSYFRKKGLYQEWFEDVLENLKSYFKEYFNYRETIFFTNLMQFYGKYKQQKWKLKSEMNILDFKDIEHLAYRLLVENKIDRDFLYFRLDNKISHLLMDEFQDTSLTQWKIFEPIVEEIASGIGQKELRTFFYVGDPKQAIYRFRGGQKELFNSVIEKFKGHGIKEESLNINFRSDKNIVEFVNQLFNLQEKSFSKEEGYIEIDIFNEGENEEKEVEKLILEKIEKLKNAGVEEENIAVLTYKNEDVIKIGNFLINNGIEVVSTKTAQVKQQPFAQAIIALLKYINNKKLKIEKLNFLSLIGEKWTDNDGFMESIKISRPIEMVKEIMDRFDLVDESTLKLLHYSQKFDTLRDFLASIDLYDEELPIEDLKGLIITTIHKSKGLEFDHVIVVDRIGKPNRNKSSIIFNYNELQLENLKLRIKNREKIDDEYKKAIEKEKALEEDDAKNVEYVAFTRAKHSLIILKKDRKSAFVIDPYDTLKKITGGKDKNYVGKIKAYSNQKKSQFQKKKTKTVTIRDYGRQTLPAEENKEYKPNDYRAIYFGNALHYAFECNSVEAVRNIYGDFLDMEKMKEYFNRSKKQIEEELKNGYKEIPFVYSNKIGRIDLMIERDKEVIIIDYKSIYPHDESRYRQQVKSYMEAIENITKKKAIGKLFYVDKVILEEIK